MQFKKYNIRSPSEKMTDEQSNTQNKIRVQR